MEALEEFGLGDSESLLKDFGISNWGTIVTFQCLYDINILLPYEIKLINCDVIRWSTHYPEDAEEELGITDIQIIPAEEYHNLPMAINIPLYSVRNSCYVFTMLTTVFEIMVVCETIKINNLYKGSIK
jgi:hypothetical protein